MSQFGFDIAFDKISYKNPDKEIKEATHAIFLEGISNTDALEFLGRSSTDLNAQRIIHCYNFELACLCSRKTNKKNHMLSFSDVSCLASKFVPYFSPKLVFLNENLLMQYSFYFLPLHLRQIMIYSCLYHHHRIWSLTEALIMTNQLPQVAALVLHWTMPSRSLISYLVMMIYTKIKQLKFFKCALAVKELLHQHGEKFVKPICRRSRDF